MKAIELRYISDFEGNEMFQFTSTDFEHELGEQVITTVNGKSGIKMTVIAREDNMTSEGYNLICRLYNNYKGTIPARTPNRFHHKVRLAIRIMAIIGKLNEDEQAQAYEAYRNKLTAQRNARYATAFRRVERILGTF